MERAEVFLIVMVLAIACRGATITVDDDGPADFNNIQDAIDAANPNDIVLVADGNYTGDGNRDLDFGGKAITVVSENGPASCIIDCNADPNDPNGYYRGFYFHSGEGANSVLEGFTITNGYQVSDGGGIFCQNSSPTITNCIITGNNIMEDPEYGGIPNGAGIGLEYSDPIITSCRITDNNAIADCMGGGIHCYYSDPLIKSCIITGNRGVRGGAINCRYGSPEIINCLLTGNIAEEYGGGIACKTGGTMKITNCTVSGNTADRGGAIDLISITAAITNSIFWGNSPSEIEHTATGVAIVTYSDIQGGWTGVGNIDANPLFAAPDNYRLVFGSPCIDAGTNSPPGGLPLTDLDGIERPFDGDYDSNAVADMGAYEFHQGANDPVLALTPAGFRFTCPVGGPNPDSRILYIWNAGGGVLWWQVAEDCNWLGVTPSSGQSSGDVDEAVISVDANGLLSDKYDCVLTVSDPCDANNTRFVPITFRVGPTLHVPADYNNIQAAIDAAFDGDEVIVADGVYTGNGNRDIDFLGKAITVRSENGPDNCIIDCQGTSNDSHRGFYFHSCEDEDSILDGFTIVNGYYSEGVLPEGGGVFCLNACTSPTIRNCIVKQNIAKSGGGISCYGSSATIMNCTITNNEAYYDKGGGILCWDHSDARITGCTVSDNRAKFHGGGIYFYGGSPVLTNSVLWANAVDFSPQQIELGGGSSLSVSYCDVESGWSGDGNIDTDPCFLYIYDFADKTIATGTTTAVIVADPCLYDVNDIIEYEDDNVARTVTDVNYVYDTVTFANDPLDANSGSSKLIYNWGPGVIDVNEDYHVKINSPCIDAGDPNYSPAPDEVDIDGEARVMGNRVDVGSDEVSDMLADFDDDGSVAPEDLNSLSGTWLQDSGGGNWDPNCDLNLDGFIDFVDYAFFAADWSKETDTEPPTEPNNLAVTGVTVTTVSLDWDASADNVAVAGYKVYRDGTYVEWAVDTNITDVGLDPGTIYTYKVSAYDAAYNESGLSGVCQVTTAE